MNIVAKMLKGDYKWFYTTTSTFQKIGAFCF